MKFKIRRYVLYYIAKLVSIFILILPYRVASFIGSLIGYLAYVLLSKDRRTAMDNLTMAMKGELTPSQIKRTIKELFMNLGRNAVELISFPKINKSNIDKLVTAEGMERIDDALKRGKGAMVILPHFGNWELLAAYFGLKGYPANSVARHIYFDKFDKELERLRTSKGLNLIYRNEPIKNLIRVLKGNGVLGILPDQDINSVDGVFVDFFGREAYTPTGPVKLASHTGAPVFPAFMIREGIRHRLVVEKPIELDDTGNAEADVKTNTARWSKVFESYIRRYPSQWVWFHKRWKTRPS
ncbi:MAG: hypothetical protein AUJ75_01435 [Candidatus Omnitrophica bacterium CG1_02_49_10]|nr:MAG: hypothetical protein AUJ75_01435 [Candidatus Omnitrophica bacterium CG1_02_49_10]